MWWVRPVDEVIKRLIKRDGKARGRGRLKIHDGRLKFGGLKIASQS
jgi:hypothetical protein